MWSGLTRESSRGREGRSCLPCPTTPPSRDMATTWSTPCVSGPHAPQTASTSTTVSTPIIIIIIIIFLKHSVFSSFFFMCVVAMLTLMPVYVLFRHVMQSTTETTSRLSLTAISPRTSHVSFTPTITYTTPLCFHSNHTPFLLPIMHILLVSHIIWHSIFRWWNQQVFEGKELRLKQEYFLVSATLQVGRRHREPVATIMKPVV